MAKNKQKDEAKLAILKEKEKLTEEINELINKKMATKDKNERKAFDEKINKLKEQKKNLNKKDTFFGDVKAEMKLVRWPSRKEVVKYSLACLAFVVLFALFFYLLNVGFSGIVGLFNK